jgi:hypothetical protein
VRRRTLPIRRCEPKAKQSFQFANYNSFIVDKTLKDCFVAFGSSQRRSWGAAIDEKRRQKVNSVGAFPEFILFLRKKARAAGLNQPRRHWVILT